jgi:HSP20 family protein
MPETQSLPNILAGLLSATGSDNSILRASLESMMAGSTTNNRVFSPYADVINTETAFNVFIDIPGVKADDIKIDFFNNQLCVSGERHLLSTDNNQTSYRRECHYGSFTKKIRLPHSVTDQKSVKVTYTDGVLFISVDKTLEEVNRFTVRVE